MNSAGFNAVMQWFEAQIATGAFSAVDCDGAPIASGDALATCQNLSDAIAAAVAALPADKFLQGLSSYNAATNVLTLAMSDGSTVDVDLTALVADAVASVPAPDGSETIVTAGPNATVTGTGTLADPYVVASTGGGTLATVADLLTPSASTGKIVTDNVLRTALGTGLDRQISIARAGVGVSVSNTDASGAGALVVNTSGAGSGNGINVTVNTMGGSGIYSSASGSSPYGIIGSHNSSGTGVRGVAIGSSGAGSAVEAWYMGAGNGFGLNAYCSSTGGAAAVRGRMVGATNGDAGQFEVGVAGTSTGTGSAINATNGPNGTRNAVGTFTQSGANTTWGITTNGAIFASGGFTPSDKRVKRDIAEIDPTAAAEFSRLVKFYTFDKLMDPESILGAQARIRAQGEADAEAIREGISVRESAGETDLAELQENLAEAESRASIELDISDAALSIGRQAGVIAQELQALTAKAFPEFAFLVRLSDPANPDSILAVDYQALDAIMSAGFQARLDAAGI